jgi:hypothetical protein
VSLISVTTYPTLPKKWLAEAKVLLAISWPLIGKKLESDNKT